MKRNLVTASLCACLLAALGWLGPALDNNGDETDQAQQQPAKQKRLERAAAEICGPNAGWAPSNRLDAIVCKTRHGRTTKRAYQ